MGMVEDSFALADGLNSAQDPLVQQEERLARSCRQRVSE
jgi:hypothetical protein